MNETLLFQVKIKAIPLLTVLVWESFPFYSVLVYRCFYTEEENTVFAFTRTRRFGRLHNIITFSSRSL